MADDSMNKDTEKVLCDDVLSNHATKLLRNYEEAYFDLVDARVDDATRGSPATVDKSLSAQLRVVKAYNRLKDYIIHLEQRATEI